MKHLGVAPPTNLSAARVVYILLFLGQQSPTLAANNHVVRVGDTFQGGLLLFAEETVAVAARHTHGQQHETQHISSFT